jgi:SAM-dependent methyltransferase
MTRFDAAVPPAPAASPGMIDLPAVTLHRKSLLSRKPFLQAVYREWYRMASDAVPSGLPGKIVELGSGAGFFKEALPDILTSDFLFLPVLDLVAQGEALPFASGALKSLVLIDVFHHIPRPRLFLSEAARCLPKRGTIVMIEPWRTAWSQFIYRRFHHEPFDPDARTWEFSSTGPLSGANGALPWIVFERDRAMFEREFPGLRVASIRLHTPLVYLLSGGFSRPAIVPAYSFRFWRRLEEAIGPRMRSWAMFARIVIVRA